MKILSRKDWEVYAIFYGVDPMWSKRFLSQVKAKTPEYKEPVWRTAFQNEDSWTEKCFVPYHFSEDTWREFEEDHWIYSNSLYDCTGRTFTVGIEHFDVPGGTWIYHHKALDV